MIILHLYCTITRFQPNFLALHQNDQYREMTARIENLLAPRDFSLTNENDWEEFSLKDVKVQLPGKSRYANLLSATDEFPVTVTGRLDIVEEEQEHLGTWYGRPRKAVMRCN